MACSCPGHRNILTQIRATGGRGSRVYLILSGGPAIGAEVNAVTNKPIDEREPHAPRVTIAPLLGRDAISVSTCLRF